MAPELSVILPVFNSEATILRAARSILESDLANLELIVVDDGSTDGTPERLSSLNDRRLRVFTQKHKGVAAAFSLGLQKTRSPWIARMDADDISSPDRLGKQLVYLRNNSIDAVGGRVRILNQTGESVPSMKRYEKWINSLLDPDQIRAFRFVECPMVNPSAMARREVFELGYRDGPWPEDYDLWLRAIQMGFRLAKLPGCLLTWTDHGKRLTRTDPRYSAAAFDRCRRMHLLAGPLKGSTRVRLWGAGKTGKPWLRWLQNNGLHVCSLTDVSDRKIGQAIHGVRVSAPDDLQPGDDIPLIIAVGAEGARELILKFVGNRGFTAGKNAWFVA